jgi:solute carrier family 35 protein F1/2
VQLLDNFTVPAVMVLSLLLLNLQYRPTHVVGACVCVTGVVTMVLNDYFTKVRIRIRRGRLPAQVRFRCLADSIRHASWMSCPQGDTDAANALLGDFLVIGAATLYAVSNVAQACGACCSMPAALVLSGYGYLASKTYCLSPRSAQEFMLRGDVGVVEWLAMIGWSGTVVGTIQFVILEGKAVADTDFDWPAVGLFAGFTASMVIFYSLVPILIKCVAQRPAWRCMPPSRAGTETALMHAPSGPAARPCSTCRC